MDTSIMLKRLRGELTALDLNERGQQMVLGVSGGPDSMAMLHALVALNREDQLGWSLHVAHLDHQIRGAEGRSDADFVADQARQLRLDCTIETENVPALSAESNGSLEQTARERRYAFFRRVCLRTGSRIVAVAHQADDNAETVLHHIIRGTGLRGLAGMPSSRALCTGSNIRLVRPMLRFRRDELLAYLMQAGVPYRQDRTNQSDEHTRNRLRHGVLPMLREEFNPQVTESLLRLAEQAQWAERHLAKTVASTLESVVVGRTPHELALNVEELRRRGAIVRAEVVRQAILSFWAGSARRGEVTDHELGFEHVRSVLELVEDDGSGRQVTLPGNVVVSRRYGQLVIRTPDDRPAEVAEGHIPVPCPGRVFLPIWAMEIVTEIGPFDQAEWQSVRPTKPDCEEWLDADRVKLPLVVRAPQPGERFQPLGAPGSKKLSDFFIDAKVPPEERQRAAILCDQRGAVWVIGHRIDNRVRLTNDTRRTVKITAKPRQLRQ